jgi:hypothetical protein
MTKDSLKERLREESSERNFAADLRPNEDAEQYQAFAYGRVGSRPQLMLCLIKCDGHHLVLPYADLRSITTNAPDKGFHLEFVGRDILVEGSSLTTCFRYLRDQRLAELVEIDRPAAMSQPTDTPVVQKITLRKPRASTERIGE